MICFDGYQILICGFVCHFLFKQFQGRWFLNRTRPFRAYSVFVNKIFVIEKRTGEEDLPIEIENKNALKTAVELSVFHRIRNIYLQQTVSISGIAKRGEMT